MARTRKERSRFYLARKNSEAKIASSLIRLVTNPLDLCDNGMQLILSVTGKTIYYGEVYEISFTDVKLRRVK